MSLSILKYRYIALLMFFNDYRIIIYCFTILSLTISGSNLLERSIFDNQKLDTELILQFFIPLLFLNIFYFVSYIGILRVHFLSTIVKVSLISLFIVIGPIFLKYENITESIKKVASFTGQKVWILGTITSQEKSNSYLFHSQAGGLGNSLIRFKSYPVLHVGQRCKIYGNVVQPKSFDDFDYKRYLFRKGIYSIIEVDQYECIGMGNIFLESRYKLEKVVEKALPEPEASLLIGIMFGSKRVFDKEFNQALNSSGVSHIIAASGYNVTLVSQAVSTVFRNRANRVTTFIKILCIWGFSIFSGLSSSLIRASTMVSISLFANLFQREGNKGALLLLCATVLILINPFIIHDVGFLFSFASVIGLTFLPKCFENMKSKFVKDSILPTLTCILFTIPISIIFFGKVSSVSLISNIVVIPIISQTIFWGLGITCLNTLFNLKILFVIPYLQLNIFKYFVLISSNIKMVELDVNKYMFGICIYLVLFVFCLYKYPVSSSNYYLLLSKKYE